MLKPYLFVLIAITFLVTAVEEANAQKGSPQPMAVWVSGTGNDSSECTRLSPCRTFATALAKVSANGIISCVDPGDFGTLTINKSVTINCDPMFGRILANRTATGITVNGDGITVSLNGLHISGKGIGHRGIAILNAERVYVNNVTIDGFVSQAIDFETKASNAKLIVNNSAMRNNRGAGLTATNTAKAEIWISQSEFCENSQGIVIGKNVTAWLSDSTITQNVNGISLQPGGKVVSFKNNRISGNGQDGNPTGEVALR